MSPSTDPSVLRLCHWLKWPFRHNSESTTVQSCLLAHISDCHVFIRCNSTDPFIVSCCQRPSARYEDNLVHST